MGIYEDIQKGQEQAKDMFQKALPTNINEVIEDIKKAKAAQLGEVRTWSGVKMRKEANGWVPVKDGSKGSGQAEEGKEGGDAPQTIEDAAKSASETALTNATKMSSDPKVREAAHKELMRRKSEEAQETFKAPEGAEGGAGNESEGDAKKMMESTSKLSKEKGTEGQYRGKSKSEEVKKESDKLHAIADELKEKADKAEDDYELGKINKKLYLHYQEKYASARSKAYDAQEKEDEEQEESENEYMSEGEKKGYEAHKKQEEAKENSKKAEANEEQNKEEKKTKPVKLDMKDLKKGEEYYIPSFDKMDSSGRDGMVEFVGNEKTFGGGENPHFKILNGDQKGQIYYLTSSGSAYDKKDADILREEQKSKDKEREELNKQRDQIAKEKSDKAKATREKNKSEGKETVKAPTDPKVESYSKGMQSSIQKWMDASEKNGGDTDVPEGEDIQNYLDQLMDIEDGEMGQLGETIGEALSYLEPGDKEGMKFVMKVINKKLNKYKGKLPEFKEGKK